ncbi:MAG: hypothetical protein JEZ11_03270 [Desulfobacterales bacterium]|nr:hypothetical protein [Desulfobacterales bacterium]
MPLPLRIVFSADHPEFAFELQQRPGRCLACNLTYGLPQVFSHHPVINVAGLVAAIDKKLDGTANCQDWQICATEEIDRSLHRIPLVITLIKKVYRSAHP